MKTPVKATRSRISFSIRMTPLIDVIFLLMIFFVMTIRFQPPEGVLENRLPEKGGQGITDQQTDWEVVRLKVKLVPEGKSLKIMLQERTVYSYEALLEYLNLLPDEILIVIEPEPKVPYKQVIGVFNTCIKSNKNNVVFAVAG